MSDAVDRLAQALQDVISEVAQEAAERARPTPPRARVAGSPAGPVEDPDQCPSCRKIRARYLVPVTEARHQLGGIGHSTFYALVKNGELPLVKIGRRTFVQVADLEEFVRRKRHDRSS